MTWVKFDDQYPISRKVAGLSDAAFRLDTEGICWSARNLTDGHIRRTQLESVSNAPRTSRKWRANLDRTAAELVSESRWHEPGHDCPMCPQPTDGWVIHDYLSYQPSRADVLREREAKAERQRRWLEKQRRPNDASRRDPRDASRDASRDGATDASRDAAPSRPAPKEAGRYPPRVADDRRQAADAAAVGQPDDGSPPYDPPRRAAPPPVDLAAVRQQLRQAASGFTAVGRRKADPLAELRAATESPPESETTE